MMEVYHFSLMKEIHLTLGTMPTQPKRTVNDCGNSKLSDNEKVKETLMKLKYRGIEIFPSFPSCQAMGHRTRQPPRHC